MTQEDINLIIQESNKKINKLKIYANFFNDPVLFKINTRIQIIHQLFVNNKDLDVSKLDLFHVQFTNSIIDLLLQLKKTAEQNIVLLDDEKKLFEAELKRYDKLPVSNENPLTLFKKIFDQKIVFLLKNIYLCLSENSSSKCLENSFITKLNNDYSFLFIDITEEEFEKLTNIEDYNIFYNNNELIFQKKLLGVLHKIDYETTFFNGLKYNDFFINVMKIPSRNEYYIFNPANKCFMFVKNEIIDNILSNHPIVDKNTQNKMELLDKINKIELKQITIKTKLPDNVKIALEETANKLEDIDFLNSLEKVDVLANVLKTMLNLEII